MSDPLFEFNNVSRRFGGNLALDNVSLVADRPSIIGLIGRNGSGKSTLLRHVVGLYLPQAGTCTTFGTPTSDLGPDQLARIGAVHQRDPLLGWLSVGQHLQYVASFYPRWDSELEKELTGLLELKPRAAVRELSPGNVQRLALVLAVCHRPQLLLLDEPLSDLDPISREQVLEALLQRFGEDDLTIVISSHLLSDIEKIVDRVVCLHAGRVVSDSTLDALLEAFSEWVVRSRDGTLPSRFGEDFVLHTERGGTGHEARVIVRDPILNRPLFAATHNAEIEERPLNLEKIFPFLVRSTTSDAGAARGRSAGWVVR